MTLWLVQSHLTPLWADDRVRFTCESQHRWNPLHCFCEPSVGLASSASCRHRCHPSRSPSQTYGASASRRRCRCRWPEPEESQRGSVRSSLRAQDGQMSPPHTYPLVWTSASGQHEDVLHFPLLLLFFYFASLIFGDDVVPFAHGLFLQLGSALFHGGEVCYLHQ